MSSTPRHGPLSSSTSLSWEHFPGARDGGQAQAARTPLAPEPPSSPVTRPWPPRSSLRPRALASKKRVFVYGRERRNQEWAGSVRQVLGSGSECRGHGQFFPAVFLHHERETEAALSLWVASWHCSLPPKCSQLASSPKRVCFFKFTFSWTRPYLRLGPFSGTYIPRSVLRPQEGARLPLPVLWLQLLSSPTSLRSY